MQFAIKFQSETYNQIVSTPTPPPPPALRLLLVKILFAQKVKKK